MEELVATRIPFVLLPGIREILRYSVAADVPDTSITQLHELQTMLGRGQMLDNERLGYTYMDILAHRPRFISSSSASISTRSCSYSAVFCLRKATVRRAFSSMPDGVSR